MYEQLLGFKAFKHSPFRGDVTREQSRTPKNKSRNDLNTNTYEYEYEYQH